MHSFLLFGYLQYYTDWRIDMYELTSPRVIKDIAKSFDVSSFKLSLMSQYTPDFCDESVKELRRRVTSFEYQSVLDCAISLGYDGYFQDKESASKEYTPNFNSQA